MEDVIAFHEVEVSRDNVIHSAAVRNDGAWIGLVEDHRWHHVCVLFDTIKSTAKVWVNSSGKMVVPDFTVEYSKTKSEIKSMSMLEILDWLFV